MRNLSTGGVRIDQPVGLEVGATVRVTVGALRSVSATVAWIRGGMAGLKFAAPINPDDARARASIAPRAPASPAPRPAVVAPTAGWMNNLNDPYRKR